MKACSNSHNLNINMYSFRELLELFQISSTPTVEDIKRAKMMVLKMHPDKSRLAPSISSFTNRHSTPFMNIINNKPKPQHKFPPKNKPIPPRPMNRKTGERPESYRRK